MDGNLLCVFLVDLEFFAFRNGSCIRLLGIKLLADVWKAGEYVETIAKVLRRVVVRKQVI
jgi:hypothetical protein